MGASGTKQGREGPGRSARHEGVRNPTRRLPGGGISGVTCRSVLKRRRGADPTRGAGLSRAIRRSSSVTLRSGEKVRRGWGEVAAHLGPGSLWEALEGHPARGQGQGGSAQPIRRYAAILNTLKTGPTTWELASAVVTPHWQLAMGSYSGGEHRPDRKSVV